MCDHEHIATLTEGHHKLHMVALTREKKLQILIAVFDKKKCIYGKVVNAFTVHNTLLNAARNLTDEKEDNGMNLWLLSEVGQYYRKIKVMIENQPKIYAEKNNYVGECHECDIDLKKEDVYRDFSRIYCYAHSVVWTKCIICENKRSINNHLIGKGVLCAYCDKKSWAFRASRYNEYLSEKVCAQTENVSCV